MVEMDAEIARRVGAFGQQTVGPGRPAGFGQGVAEEGECPERGAVFVAQTNSMTP